MVFLSCFSSKSSKKSKQFSEKNKEIQGSPLSSAQTFDSLSPCQKKNQSPVQGSSQNQFNNLGFNNQLQKECFLEYIKEHNLEATQKSAAQYRKNCNDKIVQILKELFNQADQIIEEEDWVLELTKRKDFSDYKMQQYFNNLQCSKKSLTYYLNEQFYISTINSLEDFKNTSKFEELFDEYIKDKRICEDIQAKQIILQQII